MATCKTCGTGRAKTCEGCEAVTRRDIGQLLLEMIRDGAKIADIRRYAERIVEREARVIGDDQAPTDATIQ